ncbi:branched-chain amino acid ABC transporter permease [Paraburkholderia sp. HP33-1]|uniref:branched-chain amino acid ABC transporter permease n=1 Tax=Paraburkholderia sp. HP33-1 TaxID=2883243 RepID=UPI001F25833A|nr:branched-chain amino acid ABC transporter permease [Paraburkholderia sp. HP33-1]
MVSLYTMQALHGLVYGMLLFLVASGLTLIFGLLRVINIAHAAFYMLGAYLTYAVVAVTQNFWLSLFIAPTAVGLLGAGVESGLLRRIRGHGHEHELLLTLGLFYMVSEATRWIWGNYTLEVPTPLLLVGSIPLLGGQYPIYRLFILAFSALICVLLGIVLKRTRLGIVIRSSVSDREMVSALGVNTSFVMTAVFGLGSALAAIAGVVAAPFLQVDPSMGQAILVDTFVVVVIGGFGSLAGALMSSLMIGQLKSFGILLFPQFALIFQFLLMAAVLIVRPQGLLGDKP